MSGREIIVELERLIECRERIKMPVKSELCVAELCPCIATVW
jgi:hypothetical protein